MRSERVEDLDDWRRCLLEVKEGSWRVAGVASSSPTKVRCACSSSSALSAPSSTGMAAETFCVDVECVATGWWCCSVASIAVTCHTGLGHNDRAPAQIAIVDSLLRTRLNIVVKPEAAVVSYLTPLTGLTAEIVAQYGVSMGEAIAMVKKVILPNSILTGQVCSCWAICCY